jgi:hypothetical protein
MKQNHQNSLISSGGTPRWNLRGCLPTSTEVMAPALAEHAMIELNVVSFYDG